MTNSTAIRFHKMHGLGNDFVVIDAISEKVDIGKLPFTLMADRHLGIGCDQFLIIESGKEADFFCRIVNSDGSEAEQCGNGLRCVARFVHEQKLIAANDFTLATIAGVFPVSIKDYDHISVTMLSKPVTTDHLEIRLPEFDISIAGASLSIGNPHFIIPVEKIDPADTMTLGAAIAVHPLFPQGTNVGFMEVVSEDHIRLRTYERGAGQTLACGSNACAAVIYGIMENSLSRKVAVEFEHGKVTIEWPDGKKPVKMTGPASYVFSGEWPLTVR
jgi:diaminopimelate epimerase